MGGKAPPTQPAAEPVAPPKAEFDPKAYNTDATRSAGAAESYAAGTVTSQEEKDRSGATTGIGRARTRRDVAGVVPASGGALQSSAVITG